MPRPSRRRLWLMPAAASLVAIAVTVPTQAISHPSSSAQAGRAIKSSVFWSTRGEHDVRIPVTDGVYEPNTDTVFLRAIAAAKRLPQSGNKSWRNVGPFGGVRDLPAYGAGQELFGPVEGIGTAIAVNPADPNGRTVYLGTHGGLYKSTDGGAHLKNISDKWFLRDGVGAIAVDPKHPRNLYVGTGVAINTISDDQDGVGVYVSHNAGKTFTRPKANTHGYGVNAISVLPNGSVLVGTTYGLWRSTNHGTSFKKVRLNTNAKHTAPAPHPLGSWVSAIAPRPHHSNEVTVAVGYYRGSAPLADGKTVIAPGNGLYRSTNGGKTFRYLASSAGLTNPSASSAPIGRTSLAYGPDGNLWALVQDGGRAAGETLGDLPTIEVSPTGSSVINGLYRSRNDGASWTLKATPQTLIAALGGTTSAVGYPLNYGPGVQGQYNNWVLVDPADPNRVYLGLEEAYQGEDTSPTSPAGMTWKAIEKYANACGFLLYFNTIPGSNGKACPGSGPYGGGTTHPDQHSDAIAYNPKTKAVRLYSGNDGGWWRQTASGGNFDTTKWTSLNTKATVLPWDVNFLQDGGYLLALQDNGAIHVRKNGTAYNICGGDGVYVYPGANAKSYYCGIDGQTILATTDDFKSTINVTPALNATGATFLSPWAVDITNPNHLIAAAGNVDETTHGPKSNTYDPTDEELLTSTWVTDYTPPAPAAGTAWDSSAVYTKGKVSYVAMCDLCRQSFATKAITNASLVHTLIATNVKPGCAAREASSACWHGAAGKGLPHEQVSGFAVDPHNPRTIYVSLRSYLLVGANPKAAGTQRVMVSHDAGGHFTDLTGNLPRVDAHAIVLRKGKLIVATDVGIFTAAAGTKKWSRLGYGLPQVPYRSMRLDRTGRHLLVGAYGRGAWVYTF